MPLKSTQKVVLTKTYFSKRYELTFKTLPVWAGLARDVDGEHLLALYVILGQRQQSLWFTELSTSKSYHNSEAIRLVGSDSEALDSF